MATSTVLSNWKRKCLFEARVLGSFASGYNISSMLNNLLRPVVCFSRNFAIKVTFPWTQNSTDFYPKDPFIHRLCGSVLLYRKMKLVPDGQLNPKEFLKTAKDCVMIVSGLVSQMDPDGMMSDLLGPRLDKIFKDAFATILDNNLILRLVSENVFNFHIKPAVRNTLGPSEPSRDCYVKDGLGQRLFLEPDHIEELKGSILLPPEILGKFVHKFQIGVKFVTEEKFYIRTSDGQIVQGSENSAISHHMWLFESLFCKERLLRNEYPLSWRVVDMDQCVQFRLPLYRPLSSYFENKRNL
ncbi:unnamed protein product [Porites lobata]|uniref:Tim44-like domain-containing protein n=1 Tax=Porites lobata TaxID=104759 RepID=A0ABN8NCP3_9CNID|nr:unnamed protein product [Porites lobata]